MQPGRDVFDEEGRHSIGMVVFLYHQSTRGVLHDDELGEEFEFIIIPPVTILVTASFTDPAPSAVCRYYHVLASP